MIFEKICPKRIRNEVKSHRDGAVFCFFVLQLVLWLKHLGVVELHNNL